GGRPADGAAARRADETLRSAGRRRHRLRCPRSRRRDGTARRGAHRAVRGTTGRAGRGGADAGTGVGPARLRWAAGAVAVVRAAGTRYRAGVRRTPPAGYPPLAAPPGAPPSTVDEAKDGKFERKLWWLLILLLLFALLLTGSNLLPGPAWGEMPDNRALLHVDKGTAT